MRQRADQARLRQFLEALGRHVRQPVRLYLTGGSVLIDLGLRAVTLDIDYVADADRPETLAELERAIRALKDELDINVEPAGPADFLPIPASALDRSRFVAQFGPVSVFYYHLPSLVISKAARGLEQDLADAERLVVAGEVEWQEVEETWREVRASPSGWLRHEPEDVEKRLDVIRQRLRLTSS